MRHFLFCFAACVLLAASAPARADVPPPDTLSCRMASEGDPCDPDGVMTPDGGTRTGTCRKATCSRLDYANWNRDASASPPTMSYECLKCTVGGDGGTADVAPRTDGAAPATGGSGGQGGSATGGSSGAGDDSGCSMGGGPRALGPWVLAGGFAAAVWFGRRRRR